MSTFTSQDFLVFFKFVNYLFEVGNILKELGPARRVNLQTACLKNSSILHFLPLQNPYLLSILWMQSFF